MKRMSKMLVILTLLALVLSVPAFAALDSSSTGSKEVKHGGIKFGEKGTWGFVYLLEYDEDGNLVEEGDFIPFFNKAKDGPFNITVTGPYIKDGQDVDTTIGSRLGVDYSPYIAKFNKENAILGIRVSPIVLDLGIVNLTFDGAYTFALLDLGKEKHTGGNLIKPRTNDLLFGVKGNVADLNLALAMVRYEVANDEPEVPYKYFYNVGGQVNMEVIPGLKLTALGAYYMQDKDWLYEVTGEYEVLPETLWVRAGHRNSEFEGEGDKPYNKVSVRGGEGADKKSYIDDLKPIETIYKRDSSINVGATYKFDYSGIDTTLDVDYDTTNPNKRGDLDDKVTVTADTKYLGYSLWQKFAILFPDEDTGENRGNTINDPEANRLDYYLKFNTPEFDLPVPMVDRVFAVGKLNLDWDQNYVEGSRMHIIPAVELGVEQDIWRLEGMTFGAILAYDMAPEGTEVDAFKYALIARYDAPNGIQFRLEYLNSADYKSDTKLVHNEKQYDRYDHIRFYGDSNKFHGIRLSVGFPL